MVVGSSVAGGSQRDAAEGSLAPGNQTARQLPATGANSECSTAPLLRLEINANIQCGVPHLWLAHS